MSKTIQEISQEHGEKMYELGKKHGIELQLRECKCHCHTNTTQ